MTLLLLTNKNVTRSMRSGLAFYSIIGKKNQTFIQKVSLEYNDNIMKLNNLEKRNERHLWTDSLDSNTPSYKTRRCIT